MQVRRSYLVVAAVAVVVLSKPVRRTINFPQPRLVAPTNTRLVARTNTPSQTPAPSRKVTLDPAVVDGFNRLTTVLGRGWNASSLPVQAMQEMTHQILANAGARETDLPIAQVEPPVKPVKPINPTKPNLSSLVNFAKVDDRLYRGAQPSDEGLKALKALGVRTVVSLRTHDLDSQPASELGLATYHIPMHPWSPSDADVVEWLRIVIEKQKDGPVFVHCRQGADRTGMMVAVYRIVVDGWTREAALAEMTQGGFSYHSFWKSLRKYVERMDVESIRSQVGLPATPTPTVAKRLPQLDDEPRVMLIADMRSVPASANPSPVNTRGTDAPKTTPETDSDRHTNGTVKVISRTPSAVAHGLGRVGGYVARPFKRH